jgi:hypothetical protein
VTNFKSLELLGNRLQNKQANNWWKCKDVSVKVFSCKRCERRERQVLKFLTQALWDVALFQLVKDDYQEENIVDIYSEEELKNNGILFTKIGKFCFLY